MDDIDKYSILGLIFGCPLKDEIAEKCPFLYIRKKEPFERNKIVLKYSEKKLIEMLHFHNCKLCIKK